MNQVAMSVGSVSVEAKGFFTDSSIAKAYVKSKPTDVQDMFTAVLPWFLAPPTDFPRPEWHRAAENYLNTRPVESIQGRIHNK
jgi:hypothetical protein